MGNFWFDNTWCQKYVPNKCHFIVIIPAFAINCICQLHKQSKEIYKRIKITYSNLALTFTQVTFMSLSHSRLRFTLQMSLIFWVRFLTYCVCKSHLYTSHIYVFITFSTPIYATNVTYFLGEISHLLRSTY